MGKTNTPGMTGLVQKEFAFRGVKARYFEGGSGFPILLMHGAGPGASVSTAFMKIFPRLVAHYHVFAMDFVGFGQSDPLPSPATFDFALWVDQVRAMIEVMPKGDIGVFGHSMSGAMTLRAASENPHITHVFTTGSVGTTFPLNSHLKALWTFPRSKEELRKNLGSLIYDTSVITDALIDQRWEILNQGDYPARFAKMFGGDMQAHINSWEVSPAEFGRIKARMTMVHGRNDLPCPPELTTLKIAESIPQADVVLLAQCGHAPSLEHPDKVWRLLEATFPGKA